MDANTLSNLIMALWIVGAGTIGVTVGGVAAWVNMKHDIRDAKKLATGTAKQVDSLVKLTTSVARLEEKHDALENIVKGVARDVRYMSRNMLLRNGAPRRSSDSDDEEVA